MQKANTIFVTGNSRSGTTMMGRILGNHPDVFLFRELHFYEELWMPGKSSPVLENRQAALLVANLLSIQREGYLAARNAPRWMDEANGIIESLSGRYLYPDVLFREFLHSETLREGRKIACEQTPRNIFYLDQIFASFPDAIVIEMIRDPRDVLLSKKDKWRRSLRGDSRRPLKEGLLSWANYHPDLTTRLWVSAVRAGNSYIGDPRVIRVHYEELLSNPEKIITIVSKMAGIEFNPEMLLVPQIGSSTLRDSSVLGLSTAGIGRWRNGRLQQSEIFICQKLAKTEMQALGYALEPSKPNPLGLVLSYLSLPLKLAVAILLNMRRISSFLGAIKRRIG